MAKTTKTTKKKTGVSKKNGVFERPPFGTDEFWARHEAANRAKAAKDKLGLEVRKFMDRLVKKHSKTRDPRMDIAWFFEQYGCGLRGDVEREKRKARDALAAETRAKEDQ
jgi:hypothetical protein